MSSHHFGRPNTSPSSSSSMGYLKRILVDSAQDEPLDAAEFEDVRCELRATGHNLTSVLINPRETMLENLFDDFATEQSTPLEYASPLAAAANALTSPLSFFTMSVHPSPSMHASSANTSISSSSSSHHQSSHSLHNTANGLVQILQLTQTEIEQLNLFAKKMQQVLKMYVAAHSADHHSLSGSNTNLKQLLNSPESPRKRLGSAGAIAPSSASKSKRLAADELRSCYREVPDIFFRPEFTLQNQEMFHEAMLGCSDPRVNQLLQRALQQPGNNGGSSPKDDTSLVSVFHNLHGAQDAKLSKYLDMVEVALLRQIWSRSPAFFRALDDLKGLQMNVYEATEQLKVLRTKLQDVKESATGQAKLIPRHHRRQLNESLLQTKLQYIQQVTQGKAAIMTLLEVEDYFTAQEVVANVRAVYETHLKDIHCLQQTGLQLQEIEQVISDVICNKFVSMGIQWEEMDLDTDDSPDKAVDYLKEIDMLANADKQQSFATEQKEQLVRLLHTLISANRLETALMMYKSRLIEGTKLIIRTCVMEYLSGFDPSLAMDESSPWEDSNNVDPLANVNAAVNDATPYVQRVRDMSTENFLSCLSMAFEHVVMSLKKCHVFHEYIAKTLQAEFSHGHSSNTTTTGATAAMEAIEILTSEETFKFSDKTGGEMEGEDDKGNSAASLDRIACEQLTSLSKSCVQTACEISQKAVAQLINIRKEINGKFEPEKMKFLWEISLQFVLQVEKCSGATAFIMRQCLLLQTRIFLDQLHESFKNKLVNTLDHERWVQCDVAQERQREIERLVSGKAFLANVQGLNGMAEAGVAVSSKESRPVIIDQVEYRVVWSALLLAEIIMTYLDVAFNFAPVTTEVINKIVEQIRLFNNRTKQLVLGAQAIQSAARLKSISAKHLAITSQSLSLVLALLPHIRAALLAQLPAKHQMLLTEIDRISQDLFEHHGLIVAKFVNIIGDVVENAAIKLRQVDWDRFPSGPCEYFEDMQKNIVTLHKVLQVILPPTQIQDVFTRIFGLLNRKVPTHFEEVMPSTPTGKQRILDEISHLVITLSRLKQVDGSILTTQLEETFRKKYGR